MEQIDFVVESSIGGVAVWLFADGWASFSLQDPGEDAVLVEDIVRKESDVARCFVTLGLPSEEADELAAELWDELDETEQTERASIPAPRSTP
jgi:hypothetical protein